MISGHCHCGLVKINLFEKPEYLNDCNCSLCASSGAIWGYFTKEQVDLSGETSAYCRSDTKQPTVEIRFCKNCGNATHWVSLLPDYPDRMGANMRLFTASDLDGIELRFPDGRNWTGKTDYGYRDTAKTLSVQDDIGIWN